MRNWIADADINKKVMFHIARHTFATLMLTHKNVSTTEIYGKILDTKKVDAVNKLNSLGI